MFDEQVTEKDLPLVREYEIKGHKVQIERTQPHGFWVFKIKGLEVPDGVYTDYPVAQQAAEIFLNKLPPKLSKVK